MGSHGRFLSTGVPDERVTKRHELDTGMRTQEVGLDFGGSSCPVRTWAGAWEDGTGQRGGLRGKVAQLAEPTHSQLGASGKLHGPSKPHCPRP